ncbi:MAG: ATP-binding protein [Nitrospirota bacterium]
MTNSKLFWKSSIALRILSWLLTLSLLPLLIAGFISFKASENEIKKKTVEHLLAIADSKGKMFTDFIIEKEADVKALALTPIIGTALEKYKKTFLEKGTDSSEYFALDSEFIKFFTTYTEAFGYHDLFLISHAGDIVFTVVREDDFGTNLYTGDYKDTELARTFIEAIKFGKSNISNFKFYVPSNEPAAFIGAAIVRGDTKIGAVLFQLKNRELYREVHDYIGLGKTGEIVIASKEGNEAVIIAPLRNDPTAAFKRRVPLGSNEAIPTQKAVQGENGSGLSIDYRKKEILAVWKYLPHLRWGMVIKIDTNEAYSNIYQFRNRMLTIGFIAFVIILIIGFRISRTISEPIKALQKGSEKIGRGELDTVIEIESKDEIGQLAKSFNKMTEDLKNITASRDTLNKEINERRQAEEALIRSRSKFESMFNSIPDAVVFTDTSRHIVMINPAVHVIFGYTNEELIGKTTRILYAEKTGYEDQGRKRFHVNSVPHNEPYEMTYKRKNGALFTGETLGTKVMDSSGETIGFIGIIRDITKRKQAIEEVARSNADLEQFAYIASHDLKSPLLSISGFANLLEKNYKDKLDRKANEYIGFIVNSIDRMENLINALLTYSRIGTSSSKLNTVDVNKIFVRAISNLTVEIEKNGAKVAHDSLPTVIGNDIQLEQLLQNLIGNAIKFHSQEPPRVHISVDQKGENWVFSIKDNGIGIASEDRDRIFSMFQSLHRGEYKGTGIGLAVCKKIVELHGGNIWVESQPGKGSVFYFTIPLTRE